MAKTKQTLLICCSSLILATILWFGTVFGWSLRYTNISLIYQPALERIYIFVNSTPCQQHTHLLTIQLGGRLGNNIGQYATLFYYSKKLENVTVFIQPVGKYKNI